MRALAVLAFAGLLTSAAAVAGQPPLTYDRVHLSVDAEARVANDTLVAVLYVQREGPRQGEVAREVNDTMRWALVESKRPKNVSVQTLGYSTSPVYRNNRIEGWRVRQSLRLESREEDVLTELMGKLQERLSIESVNYEISREARLEAEDGLLIEALANFRARAELVAREMKRPGYRVVDMQIGTGGGQPPPRPMRTMAMAEADVSRPAVEAGEQTLTVTVSGTVELDPPQ